MTSKNQERELLPDILRGFAIILVVLGHCIQEGSGGAYKENALYFSDKLYQFIYSFHMPLFMLVSGYLNWTSIKKANGKKERRMLLKRRACALLLPVFLWTTVDYVKMLSVNYVNGVPQPSALIFVYFYNALNNLWFLWAVWWCFLIVYIMHYFLRDNVIIYLIGFLCMFVIPDGLGLMAYKYMLPYFIMAYYFHGFLEKEGQHSLNTPKLWSIAILGLAFLGLFVFYNEDSFIYLTGYKLIGKNVVKQLWIDVYRLIIGIVGSIFFIFLWKYILDIIQKWNEKKNMRLSLGILVCLGNKSMGIFILSGRLLLSVMHRIDFIDRQSYLLNFIEAIVFLAVSLFLTILFERIPVLKKFVGK